MIARIKILTLAVALSCVCGAYAAVGHEMDQGHYRFRVTSENPAEAEVVGFSETGFEAACKGSFEVAIPAVVDGYVVTAIAQDAFKATDTKWGTEAIISVALPTTIRSIGQSAFFANHKLMLASLPEGLVTIGKTAFQNTGLRQVKTPTTLTSLGLNCFVDNSDLLTADLSASSALATIESATFHNCTALEEIRLGSGVRKVEKMAFAQCYALHSLYVYATTPPDATDETFVYYSKDLDFTLYVPKGCRGQYAATVWGTYAKAIEEFEATTPTPQVVPESIKLDRSVVEVQEGRAVVLHASVFPPECSDVELSWSSSDTSVATVETNGTVTGIRQGNAVVTVYPVGYPTLAATCAVMVVPYSQNPGDDEEEVQLTIMVANDGSSYALPYSTGKALNLKITPPASQSVASITLNGRDITANLNSDMWLTTAPLTGDALLLITYKQGNGLQQAEAGNMRAEFGDGLVSIYDMEPFGPVCVCTVDGKVLLRGTADAAGYFSAACDLSAPVVVTAGSAGFVHMGNYK